MEDTIPEVLITSGNTCSVYDINNGNEMMSYKDENTFSPKTLSLIGSDYLIGAFSNKPKIKVWTIAKQRKKEEGTFIVPGVVSALAVSSCGNYCIAGIKEKIYVWEVSSGKVLNILSRHYQAISCLKFTADDSRFLSGGKDGHVMVWVLSCAIDVSFRHGTQKPHFLWNKHSAEVTDIYSGISVSRVATTSLDMTCKIFELDSGILLSSICMDVPLTCVVMDPLEYFVILGDDRGYIYRINTYEKLPREIHRADMNNKAAIQLHETKIISISVTFDGTKLLTAGEDQVCKLWDLQSMACVMNIRVEGALTNAFLAIRPPGLNKNATKEEILPRLFVRTFQKDISPFISDNKCIESIIFKKDLSLVYDGCPDKHYPDSFIYTGRKPGEIDASSCEEDFQEAIYGESLSNLTVLNQQLFTVSLNNGLGIMFGGPPSPS